MYSRALHTPVTSMWIIAKLPSGHQKTQAFGCLIFIITDVSAIKGHNPNLGMII
jgi:hypothetical protein